MIWAWMNIFPVSYTHLDVYKRQREFFAKQNGADFTKPITAGIFVSIVAWASYQLSLIHI